MVLCPEHPKRDQHPKFTSETTSIPICFSSSLFKNFVSWTMIGIRQSQKHRINLSEQNFTRQSVKETIEERTEHIFRVGCKKTIFSLIPSPVFKKLSLHHFLHTCVHRQSLFLAIYNLLHTFALKSKVTTCMHSNTAYFLC